jgi:hypothetical protein
MGKDNKARLRPLLVMLFLASMLLVSLCTMPAFTAGPGSGSGPLPPTVIPVIILKGSDYDMGHQYAQQVIALFGPWFFQKTPGVYEPFTDTQIKALKAYQRNFRENFPEMIDYIKGMADGATAAGVPMTYTEAMARTTGTKPFPGTEPAESTSETLPPDETCAVWSAWGKTTKDGSLIAGDSFDAGFGLQFVTVAFPDTGNAYVLGNGLAMNNKGVWIGGSAGEGLRPIDRDAGYDVANTLGNIGAKQHALRFANTAKEALDFYTHWKWEKSENRMFGDLGGGHFVLEGSAAFKSVRKAGDFGEGDFLHMRNNFFTAEGGKANLADQPGKFYPHGGWVQDPPPGVTDPDAVADIQMASVRTNQTMYNMLSQYQGEVDLEFAKMLWRFAGKMPKDPWSIAEFRATKGRAWETPGNLNNVQVNICIPDNVANGKVYICAGPAGRVATPYNADPPPPLTGTRKAAHIPSTNLRSRLTREPSFTRPTRRHTATSAWPTRS